MEDFMYNKVMQLIEEKLQLELKIIRLEADLRNLQSDQDLKVISLEKQLTELEYDNFKLKNK